MNVFLINLKLVYSKFISYVVSIFLFVLMYSLFALSTNEEILFGNYGLVIFSIHIISQILISFLFAIFFVVSLYKYFYFASFSVKENSSTLFGTILGTLAAGCPACSITLSTYLGLASALSLLPYDGLELKLLAILILSYATFTSIKNLTQCKLKR